MLGIGLIIPVVTPLLLDPTLTFMGSEATFADRSMMIGFLLASFSLAQFVGSGLLGSLSDRYGRKPILRYTVAGTLLSYLVFGTGIVQTSLPLLFVGRLLLGFCSGNLAVTFSAIADLSSAEHKSRNFGMVGAAFGIGFVLGPFLGGFLSDSSWHPALGYDTPFWVAALLSVVNLWVLQRFFTETLVSPRMSPLHLASGLQQIAKAFSRPELKGLFVVSFFMVFGFNFFTQFIQVYLIKRFDFGQGDIGALFGYLGLWIALTQGLLLRPVSARVSPAPILKVSLLLMGLAVVGILVPDRSVLLYAILPLVSIGQGFSSPNLLSLISNKADSSMQGEILGINQSVNSFAQLLPPLIGGFIVALDIRAPLLVSGSFIVLAWLTFVSNRSYRS